MVELSFNVEPEDIQVFNSAITENEARQLAEEQKEKVFGAFSGFMRKIGKKEGEEIVMSHYEKKYYPFWHIKGKLYLEYTRMTEYQVEVPKEVIELKIHGVKHKVPEGTPYVQFAAEDHCLEVEERGIICDAMTGREGDFEKYIDYKSRKIKEVEDLMGENNVVFPAKVKASFLIRDMIKDLIKPFHADAVIKEVVEINGLRLYFHPSYAFEFKNTASNKTKVLEIDGITGDVSSGTVVKKEMGELFTEGELFKLGKDITYTIIPGAEATEKLVKHIRKKKKDKKTEKIKDELRRGAAKETSSAKTSSKGKKKSSKKSSSSKPKKSGKTPGKSSGKTKISLPKK